jgi:transcriptional regulator with XRE-family HTH domain
MPNRVTKVPAGGAGRQAVIDLETRERIVAHLRQQMELRQVASIRQMAEKLGLSHTYLIRTLSGVQTGGLELVIRMHRVLHISSDVLLDENPPQKYFEKESQKNGR